MVRTIKDFLERWQEEAKSTQRIINALTDESLQANAPGTRTLGRLANHLIETLSEFPHKLGLPIEEEFITYNSVAELSLAYQIAADRVLNAVAENWQDEILEEYRDMYGEKWQIGVSLYYLLAHQTHHRAQMTTLMRLAGLRVPGVYGPSKEDWKEMNMAPLE
jgi:uncharacterized damage-inducible protein DinB